MLSFRPAATLLISLLAVCTAQELPAQGDVPPTKDSSCGQYTGSSCLPEGVCCDLCFGVGTAPGSIMDGAKLWEVDTFFDDFIEDLPTSGEPGGTVSACTSICNHGGQLETGDGTDIDPDGGGEAEIQICIYWREPKGMVYHDDFVTLGVMGGQWGTCETIWERHHECSQTRGIDPC